MKRQEYIDYLENSENPERASLTELLEQEKACNALHVGILPYEYDFISGGTEGFENAKVALKEILAEPIEAPVEVEKEEPEAAPKYVNTTQMPMDPLLKFKEHERERYRERRVRAIMDDKKNRYARRLANLQRWEI